jgi:hypothetical protein
MRVAADATRAGAPPMRARVYASLDRSPTIDGITGPAICICGGGDHRSLRLMRLPALISQS